MKVKPSPALTNVRAYRVKLKKSQAAFWNPVGVGQSGASRYEIGRPLPPAVAVLVVLREAGKITDADLNHALAVVEAST